MADEGDSPPPEGEEGPETIKSFPERLVALGRWAVAGLAAAAAFAVTNIGLDDFGTGTSDHDGWAFFGIALFALGIAMVVLAVAWIGAAGRASLPWLVDANAAHYIRKFFNDSGKYMLAGHDNLALFVGRLTALVKKGPDGTTADERKELRRLLEAREDIRKTAASERSRRVSKWAAGLVLLGVLTVALGTATFAFSVNRDNELGKERLSGELLPKTPSSVLMSVPSDYSERAEVQQALGSACSLADAKVILVEFGRAPRRDPGQVPVVAVPSRDAVAHVVSERTDKCNVSDFWIPPAWLLPRPEEQPETTGGEEESGSAESESAG